ncbi:ParB/RepB/Spo0J family partition protein [Stenotrophomonas maltophilia]|nr:ParB/RepB/Spo0J family partition protein [Stenotrophomonas maltophilia]
MNAASLETLILPLSALYHSPRNARKRGEYNIEGVRSLAECIMQMGLLQNLGVCEEPSVEPGEESRPFGVVLGGRRLAAYNMLLDEGRIDPNHPIHCLKLKDDLTIASLVENTQRENMRPADEYEKIREMSEVLGYSVDRISDLLGVSALVVERRLELSKAHPELIQDFRDDKITTNQLIALCTTTDRARQLELWRAAKYPAMRDPKELRKKVLAQRIDCGSDPRIKLIGGLAAFRAAGAVVHGDLFSDSGDAGISEDVGLLEKLVVAVAEAKVSELETEGWNWVQFLPEGRDSAYWRLGNAVPSSALSDEEFASTHPDLAAEIARVEARIAEIEAQEDEEAFNAEYGQLEDELSDLSERRDMACAVYSEEQKAHAGAVVWFDEDQIMIERGKVRTEDRKGASAATGTGVVGGREKASAGRKEAAMSDAITRSLLGRRNALVQLQVAQNPRVAKVLLAVSMASLVTFDSRGFGVRNRGVCDLTLSNFSDGARLEHPTVGSDGEALRGLLRSSIAPLVEGMPESPSERFVFLSEKSDAVLDAIIAHGVGAAVSVNALHKGATATLLESLDFQIGDHMEITADNFFNHVPKAITLSSLKDAGQDYELAVLEGMKKDVLAAEAERRIKGTGWFPELIRSPARQAAPQESAGTNQAPKTGATTPAKKLAGKKAADKKPVSKAAKAPAKRAKAK